MGFDHMTVQLTGRGDRFFSAVASETEEERVARESKEVEQKLKDKIANLQKEIAEKKQELSSILGCDNE